MSDTIQPIVIDTDEPSSGDNGKDLPDNVIDNGSEDLPHKLTDIRPEDLLHKVTDNGSEPVARPVRKTRSDTSSKLGDPKVLTIRQHYYPEGGWGWVVCACAFLVNALTHGLVLSYGILGQEVVKVFGEEYQQQATWLGPGSVSLGLLCSPLIVGWCRRKSPRLAAVLGGLVATLGCLFASFASQMHQVFVSYVCVMTVGLSLARVTSFLMIGQYFKRKRERVEAVVISGVGAGVVIFSFTFGNVIGLLGWRLGLQAVTGLTALPFFLGLCYRPASLYHPQRRAILHLKNQRKKIKDKAGHSSKPPLFDLAPLKSHHVLLCVLAASLCVPAMYAPFFHLVPLGSSLGLRAEQTLVVQLHLGAAFCAGCWTSGSLVSYRGAECVVGRRQLCQAGMLALGLACLSAQVAKNYAGLSLCAWMMGAPCGLLHHSLRMLLLEKGRHSSYARTWTWMEMAQALPLLLGVQAVGWLNRTQGIYSGFYLASACPFAAAIVLSFLGLPQRYHWSNQGSCSTCVSQAPSCSCTHEYNHTHSQQDSPGNHRKCQKTISFSDTVDVADEPNTAAPLLGKQPTYLPRNTPDDNIDVDAVNADIAICYADEFVRNDAAPSRQLSRYGCGHLLDCEELEIEKWPCSSKEPMVAVGEATSCV